MAPGVGTCAPHSTYKFSEHPAYYHTVDRGSPVRTFLTSAITYRELPSNPTWHRDLPFVTLEGHPALKLPPLVRSAPGGWTSSPADYSLADPGNWANITRIAPMAESDDTSISHVGGEVKVHSQQSAATSTLVGQRSVKRQLEDDERDDEPGQGVQAKRLRLEPNDAGAPSTHSAHGFWHVTEGLSSPLRRPEPSSPRFLVLSSPLRGQAVDSPKYCPPSPRYSPASPLLGPESPHYTPPSPRYTPPSPRYSPPSPNVAPFPRPFPNTVPPAIRLGACPSQYDLANYQVYTQPRRSNADFYNPIWCRGEGAEKEGWCDFCDEWKNLKRSDYW